MKLRDHHYSAILFIFGLLVITTTGGVAVTEHQSRSANYSYSYSPEELLKSFKAVKSKFVTNSCSTSSNSADNSDDETTTTTVVKKQRRKQSSSKLLSDTTTDGITVAAIQITSAGLSNNDIDGFLIMAKNAIHDAATTYNADIILLPELFYGPYFCQSQEASLMGLAEESNHNNFILRQMQELAYKYNVVLPISFYERHNNMLYNSIVIVDGTSSTTTITNSNNNSNDTIPIAPVLDNVYRKSHIPDGTGYQEKFYFSPGDTGFQVWEIAGLNNIKIGVGICWDQWFPETARIMALQGADVLFFPTAIGSEPQDPTINSANHWQRVMQGHAAANMIPIVASNRYGTEILLHDKTNEDKDKEKQRIHFYGRSFITDETGDIVQEAADNYSTNTEKEEKGKTNNIQPYIILTSTINPEQNRLTRMAWGLFRDRRPELYSPLQTKDGKMKH